MLLSFLYFLCLMAHPIIASKNPDRKATAPGYAQYLSGTTKYSHSGQTMTIDSEFTGKVALREAILIAMRVIVKLNDFVSE